MNAALKYATITLLFAPALLIIAGSLVRPSCYVWIARKETLRTIWDLLATLGVFFRASAGTEALRIFFRPGDTRLPYMLSLSVTLPWLLNDGVRGQPPWLLTAVGSLGNGLGIQVVSSWIAHVRTCEFFTFPHEILYLLHARLNSINSARISPYKLLASADKQSPSSRY